MAAKSPGNQPRECRFEATPGRPSDPPPPRPPGTGPHRRGRRSEARASRPARFRIRDSVLLDARLAAVLGGNQAPVDELERTQLAFRAYEWSLFASSARLYAEAIANDPKLAADRQAQHLYTAACAPAASAGRRAWCRRTEAGRSREGGAASPGDGLAQVGTVGVAGGSRLTGRPGGQAARRQDARPVEARHGSGRSSRCSRTRQARRGRTPKDWNDLWTGVDTLRASIAPEVSGLSVYARSGGSFVVQVRP